MASIPVRLSTRQKEILRLMQQNLSSKEIADALCVSKRTVDFHKAAIYDKVQVSKGAQAVRTAVRMGLIPFEAGYKGN